MKVGNGDNQQTTLVTNSAIKNTDTTKSTTNSDSNDESNVSGVLQEDTVTLSDDALVGGDTQRSGVGGGVWPKTDD